MATVLAWVNDYPFSLIFDFTGPGGYMQNYYLVPWTRYQPYIVGMILGFILHRMRNKKNLKINSIMVTWIWVKFRFSAWRLKVFQIYNIKGTSIWYWMCSNLWTWTTVSKTTGLPKHWWLHSCSKSSKSILQWPPQTGLGSGPLLGHLCLHQGPGRANQHLPVLESLGTSG